MQGLVAAPSTSPQNIATQFSVLQGNVEVTDGKGFAQ